jgi:hypothetical protein
MTSLRIHAYSICQDIGSTESEADHAEIERLEEHAAALRKVLSCKFSS